MTAPLIISVSSARSFCLLLFYCFIGLSNGRSLFSLLALCSDPRSSSFQENKLSSDIPSSPERYASALNMTIEQVKEQKNRHLRASETLQIRLQSKDLSGKEKHEIMCHHRLKYGRHPFACPNCWSYLPVCVCDLVEKNLHQEVPDDGTNNLLQVVVWTHHREWGLTSNTGSILALAIPNYCQLLMKGLPEHDKILEETILQDENCLAVVLWPDQSKRKEGNNKDEDETPSSIISLDQVKDEIRKNQRRVVLIAVDGTWRNARRMVARLPPTVPRLDLSADVVFSDDSSHGRSSILAPLRTRGESGDGQDSDGRQVCTAEAVVGALMSLGTLDQHQGRHVLDVTRTKIERIGRYRGQIDTYI